MKEGFPSPSDRPSWMTYRQFRACFIKKPYTDEAEARSEVERIASLPGVFAPERLEVYTCSWCKKLHIGHVSLKEVERRAANNQQANVLGRPVGVGG